MTRRNPKTKRADRAATARRLIEQLRLGTMTAADIRAFLGYGPSGAGKYARDMHRAGVTTCETSGLQHLRTYTLTGDQAAIDLFLMGIEDKQAAPRASRDRLSLAVRRGGRYFHLLADDTYNQTKVAPTEVAADPLALPRQFFAQAAREALEDDLLERAPIVTPPRPGFPDPAHYRLDLSPEVRS